jgi:flagellin-like protein
MNVFGQSERSWRKARKRGVSPIIATILLVAITVVLAAVLYVLISGLTHGTGSTPLGTAIGFGSATPTHPSTANPSAGCAGTDYCYTIAIASASGVVTSDLEFKATGVSGATVTFTTVKLMSVTSTTLATWTSAGGSVDNGSVTVTTADYFVVDMGTSSVSGAGDSLVALGVGGFSGSVSIALP